jgi:hypothetical protein
MRANPRSLMGSKSGLIQLYSATTSIWARKGIREVMFKSDLFVALFSVLFVVAVIGGLLYVSTLAVQAYCNNYAFYNDVETVVKWNSGTFECLVVTDDKGLVPSNYYIGK